jgi:hypothetical protein
VTQGSWPAWRSQAQSRNPGHFSLADVSIWRKLTANRQLKNYTRFAPFSQSLL